MYTFYQSERLPGEKWKTNWTNSICAQNNNDDNVGRVYRKSDLLVAASGQRGGVVRAGPFRPQDVHDVVQREPPVVRDRAVVVRRRPGRSVRRLGADGLQRGLRHQLLDIVLRRGVRAQAPRHAHVRPQLVLLRRLPVRDHAVRHHGRLETVRARHRGRAAVQHRAPVQGSVKRYYCCCYLLGNGFIVHEKHVLSKICKYA